ncbi:invasion associated locus B family protein [Frigidibacter sp.]|uniref:invasion associated locus B family protein n=1 Tax=Frigidibacter sp. TaxID=2586418 RepID=UPI0027375D87|nr:invasion associated locus B family protein [Frigidibacter sp.]MDP3340114.1 invasion associated locus B family protein [Frigidibacter sp.]
MMTPLRPALALALALGLGLPAMAQDAAAPATTETPAPAATPEAPAQAPAEAPAAEAPAAAETEAADAVPGIGEAYTEATHGDWEQRCVRTEDGSDPCQLYQLLKDQDGNPVAEFSLFGLPEGEQAAAGGTIMTPLETLLPEAILMQVDTGEAKRYAFTFCAPIGCVARVGFTDAEIASFKKGNKATMAITPMAAPDRKVQLNVSLKGFTAGYDAVNAANADLAAN